MLRLVFISVTLVSSLAFAKEKRVYAEAIEPAKACERFLAGPQKDRCVKTLNRPTADSYLTSICDRQEDDTAFFECIDLADKFYFDPRKIQTCSGDMEDPDRVNCLQSAGRRWKESKPEREPASKIRSKKRTHKSLKPSVKKNKSKTKKRY